MAVSLSAERDRIQRQVEELQQSLSVTRAELDLLSSETDDESGDDNPEEQVGQSAAGVVAQRDKIQKEIQNLENVLGLHSPVYASDGDDSSSDESDLDLSPDSCLQLNLVYQQVVQETLDQLETLLTQNHKQQEELLSQLSGPIKMPSREQSAPSSYQQPMNMFLGRFLKPYFKDKLTGLGPPANQETKEKSSRMTGCLDDKKIKMKRWESWQKTLLIHSAVRDSLRRLIQPKLSRVDYLSQKLSSAEETERQQLKEQIDSLEKEIDLLKGKKEEELIGDRYEEHDWQKISNIDFEGTKDAEDIRCFWQNFLHPSINKTQWSQEEVQQLKEVSSRHGERHWETIAHELGTGRTAFMCLQTFQRFVSDSLRRSVWTPPEDALLRELVEKMRIGNFIPYTQISYFMEGRDPTQLIYRWTQVLDPSLKKGTWTKEEDQLLLRAVSRYGEKSWWKVRLEVPGRTDSACRDRYIDCLKVGTKRGAFDKQEQELLLRLVEKHGVGRWAKIAAEIPHRFDAQCLREWRKLSKQQAPPAQKDDKGKKTPKSRGGGKNKRKRVPRAKKSNRKRVKEEEESSEEEEEMVVEYMDSDEEKKKKKVVVEEERIEEVEEEYFIPPMDEWVPAEKPQHFTFLSFRPVALPSSGDSHCGHPVRSTILGEFGRSVIIGPSPRELPCEERHSSSTMMMVSPDQLRAHLHQEANKFTNQSSDPQVKRRSGKHNHPGQVTDLSLSYELQAAVTPWIGNLLIPAKTRRTVADALREQGEKTKLTSTPIFLLFLQTMNVDTMGCKKMIEQRRDGVVFPTTPPDPPPVQIRDPQTVAGMLQRKRAVTQEQRELDLHQGLILKQLQVLEKQKYHPDVVLQVPPNIHPRMSPMSFPQAVFLPQIVLQPQQSAFTQLITPSTSTIPVSPHRPPPAGLITSLEPAHPVTPTCSTSFHHQALTLAQNLKVALPPPNDPAVATATHSLSLADSTVIPPTEDSQMTACRSKGGEDFRRVGNAMDEAPTGVDKTRTLQEVIDPKDSNRPTVALLSPQQLCTQAPASSLTLLNSFSSKTETPSLTPPPAGETTISPPSLRVNVPLVSVDLFPVSLQDCTAPILSSAPPPSLPANQHRPHSTSKLPAPVPRDHDYTFINPIHTPGQQGTISSHPTLDLKQPTPPRHESNSNEAPKPHTRGRKRGRTEEQQRVTGSQDEDCVVQEGKRVRKLSQKAKALQESTQAKVETKKRTSSRQKPSRTSHSANEVVQTQTAAQLPLMSLLSGQSMWVMTPGGLVQLAEAQPRGLQLALVPSAPLPPPSGNISNPSPASPPPRLAPKPSTVSVPITLPNLNQPHLRPAPPTEPSKPLPPTLILQPGPNPSSPSIPPCHPPPPQKLNLPYKDTVSVDPEDPSRRTEGMQFNPSLMFLEPQAAVCDWFSGRQGVVVPGLGMSLPYLPPFVSSLSMLSKLLQAKKSLTTSSLQLLRGVPRPKPTQTKPKPSSTKNTLSQPPPDLPDSTSDLRLAEDQPASSGTSGLFEEVEEAELVTAVRQLVAERFSSNPAYQLLKARFLSCFTVPALLATIQPNTTNEEEEEKQEDEEEVELKKIKERGRQRRSEKSLLLSDNSRPAANHFSGIITSSPLPTRPDQ
ncbi:snRNA-activating protein complex subunit 4 [Mastacembelus armatus]|uniref:snRNA-activating protein complex subunit 4 n=1 Tax=Mastacembelus armatus TaxID=205130 RepID=UPI000E45AF69|nr:snRNA-activating protein complex subunit 4 [Mastacembelus armatus]